jgi:hypothetical protein
VLAALFELGSYAGYVLLLRGVMGHVGDERLSWPEACRLTLAGVAASRLLAGAGAGGIALTGWALARMGMSAHTASTRLATFFELLYAVFMGALVVTGLGLSVGWFAGPAPFGLTVVPAVFAAIVIVAALALALMPPKFGRLRGHAQRPGEGRGKRIARYVAAAPATLGSGVRDAEAVVRANDPALLGALVWWTCDLLVLWAAMHAFGTPPPRCWS